MTDSSPRPRLLVVDDERDTLELCRRLLGNDYDVELATTAQEGLDILAAHSCCAVLVDHNLSGSDGLEFLSTLRQTRADTARILMTGYASQDRVIAAINEGNVNAYIVKPWKVPEFREIIDREVALAQLRLRLAEEHRRYSKLVYDDVADLPTRQLVEADAAKWLTKDGFLGVLVVDASELWTAQAEFGRREFEQIGNRFVEQMKRMHGEFFRKEDILAVDEVGSPAFCIILAQPRTERTDCAADVMDVGRRLQERLNSWATEIQVGEWWPRVGVGHGFVLYNQTVSPTYLLRRVFGEARDHARRHRVTDEHSAARNRLERIIVQNDLSAVFQPIVDLAGPQRVGYEVLSRGPRDSRYEKPLFMIRVAERVGLGLELEQALRTTVLKAAGQVPGTAKLFVNVMPSTLDDPSFAADAMATTLDNLGVDARRLVVELNERHALHDHPGLVALAHAYREIGIHVALDDLGVGYSGLERITRLQPQYLKLDISLVREIHRQPVKQAVAKALTKLADDTGASVIAEGIETPEERDCLTDLGVPLGQGFLLGRPAPWGSPELAG